MPSATLDSQSPGGHADRDGITTVEVRASNRIENEQEYQLRLAAWGSACETAVNESVEQYIASMIVLIVCGSSGRHQAAVAKKSLHERVMAQDAHI